MLSGCTPWPPEFVQRYRRDGLWLGQSIGTALGEWSRRSGEDPAVVDDKVRWSYRELDERARALAAGFHALGVRATDRVVVQLPNRAEFFEVLFGLLKLGAIPVLVLPAYRHREVSSFCVCTEAVAYVTVDRYAGFDFAEMAGRVHAEVTGLRHVVVLGEAGQFTPLADLRTGSLEAEVDAGEIALLHLSGGTTGTPKLVPRTHDDYLYGTRASAELCGLGRDTAYLCSLPVAHQFPLSAPGALGTLLCGGKVVLAANPAPDVTLPLIEQERITIAALVPAMANLWTTAAGNYSADLSSLGLLQVGGAKLDRELAGRIGPALGCRVQQVFGMSEGLLNFTRLDEPNEIVFGTQGRPLSPADELRIVDDEDREVAPGIPGHLQVRGPYTIRGYFRSPEHDRLAFTSDGFYRTGDIVRQTPTGHLVVVDRAKDQINRAGEKISAGEIETELLAHPAVAEVAAVGIPDAYLGERLCAYVVPATPVTAAELDAHMRSRGLAAHKVPDRFEFIDALPRTAVGKINKQWLREHASEEKREPG